MSFSGQMKIELAKIVPQARHCQLAELAALYKFCNKEISQNPPIIVLSSENEIVIQKCFTLLKKTFNMYKDFSIYEDVGEKRGATFKLEIRDTDVSLIEDTLSQSIISLKSCCRRAYIRGAFIATGSISDPEKSYHLEYVCQTMDDADFLVKELASFDIEAKIIQRKKYYVVYVKDGTQIVDVLNVMGAHMALMDFENARIVKEVRNSVNRKINCELANIGKTVSAAQKQIEDIKILVGSDKYRSIPDNLKEIAELRLKYQEATLKELGELLSEPLGKSGVNHRLRKLSELAEAIKEENYDQKGSSNPS